MHKIVLFGGTTEGRLLTEFLSQNKIPAIVCVATEYGEKVLEYEPPVIVQPKRLKPGPMRKLFEEEQTEFVFDATHPYATEISKHIKEICDEQGIEYIFLTSATKDSAKILNFYTNEVDMNVHYSRLFKKVR